MKTQREHLANFHIAGLTFYEAALCFKKLKVGTELRLELETENKFYARAVAIYYNDYKLGFVPLAENRIFYKLLASDYNSNFDAVIQQIDSSEHPEKQICVIVHLKHNNSQEI